MLARAPESTPWATLPDDLQEAVHAQLRDAGKRSLYVFNKGVLGFRDLTPSLHLPYCNFLQLSPDTSGIRAARLKAAIMSRNLFKSTNSSVGKPLWLLVNDPQATVNIINAVEENAVGWLQAIQRVVRLNPVFRWLYPEIIPQDWRSGDASKTRFTVRRDESLMPEPQPSIQVSGITSGQASKHVRHIILDDPVNEQTFNKPTLIDRAVGLYKLLESTLQDYEMSTIDLVATPWGFGDVVEYALENEVAHGSMLLWKVNCYGDFYISPEIAQTEFLPFWDKGKRPSDLVYRSLGESSSVEMPFMASTKGEPVFPERYPREELQRIEKKYGPFMFSANYLVDPFDNAQAGFSASHIHYFNRAIDGTIKCDCHKEHKHRIQDLHLVATVDPAWSDNDDAADSAIVVGGMAEDGCRFLFKAWADQVDPATLWNELLKTVDEFKPYLKDVGIEEVSSQRLYRFFFEQMQRLKSEMKPADRAKVPNIRIEPLKPDTAMNSKIRRIKAEQLYLSNGQWHFQLGMDKFLKQYAKFPRARPLDLLDAWAYLKDMWVPPAIKDSRGFTWNDARNDYHKGHPVYGNRRKEVWL